MAPLIYVGTHAVASGKEDAARTASEGLARFLEENHPTVLHFEIFVSDDGREMTVIQVHPDEASLLTHIQLAGSRIAQAYDFLEGTTEIRIFGDPSEALTAQIHGMAMGAPLMIHRNGYGFSRLATASV